MTNKINEKMFFIIEKTREQKIAERVAYMQQQQNNSDNLN